MVKELIIAGYLFVFKVIFNIFKIFPQKNKATYVVSFEENSAYLLQEMRRQQVSYEVVVLSKARFSKEFHRELQYTTFVPFETMNIKDWFKGIYHLATSKVLIVDNYFAFLSVTNFKGNMECIQIWHAGGALKTFGLQDQSVELRSNAAKQRFKKVYEKFHKVVVGADIMADIFMKSFGLPPSSILRTGVPRTDFFYEKENHERLKVAFKQQYPLLKKKKVILYAPTFRDSQLDRYEIKLDINRMYQELKQDYILLIKLHPAVKTNHNYQELYPDFVLDFSSYKRINELLVISDLLITDYSSIPFEFALLKKPMIFYPYDLEFYKKERGVIQNYETEVPGPIAFETEQLIRLILNNEINIDEICEFSHKWNEFSLGMSSKQLVDYIGAKIHQ